MTFDISDTLAPKSDQLDAVDLVGAPPRIFTIVKVGKGSSDEQPVQVTLAEFPRVWRPGKSMRRVLASCWGTDASAWAGRRVELFCDEEVTFGSEKVGGIRISRLSDISGPKSVPIIIKKGRSGGYKVGALPELTAEEKVASLRAEWKNASPERRKVIEADVAALTGQAAPAAQDTPTAEASEPDEIDPTLDESWGEK